jgi:hypothetical protein
MDDLQDLTAERSPGGFAQVKPVDFTILAERGIAIAVRYS